MKSIAMNKSAIAIALAASLALPLPLAAQDSPAPPSDEEIVVEGEREPRSWEAREQARDITPRARTGFEPLARFQNPICPGVWGLAPASAQLLIDRIYQNAEQAGVAVNITEGCRANIWVIFVDDPQAEFAKMRRESEFLLDGLDHWELERIEDQDGPAIAWNLTSTRTREGMLPTPGSAQFETTLMSRTNTAVREDIELSVVLIRRDAVADLDVVAVADYATMRALAKTEPPRRDTAYSTALALFDRDSAPTRLTEFDLAYLQDLYSSRATQPGRQGHGRVAALMDRQQISED